MFLVFPVFTFRYLFDAPHPNLSFEQGEQGQGHSFIILSSLRLSAQRGFVWRTEDSGRQPAEGKSPGAIEL